MTTHLIRIAWTAALCVGLGVVLFVAAEMITATSDPSKTVIWLALALASGLLLFASPHFVEAWRSGEMHERTGRVRRTQEPVAYWALMALHGASLVALAALVAYCAMRLTLL